MLKYKYMIVPENAIEPLKKLGINLRRLDDTTYLALHVEACSLSSLGEPYQSFASGRVIYKEKIDKLNDSYRVCLDCTFGKIEAKEDVKNCIIVDGSIEVLEVNKDSRGNSNYKHLPTIIGDWVVSELVLNCRATDVVDFKCDKLIINIAKNSRDNTFFKNCEFKTILHNGMQDFGKLIFQNTTLTYDPSIIKSTNKKYIPFLVHLLSDQTMYTSRNDIIKTIQHIESKKSWLKKALFKLHRGYTKLKWPLIFLFSFTIANGILLYIYPGQYINDLGSSQLKYIFLPNKILTDLAFKNTQFGFPIDFELFGCRFLLVFNTIVILYMAFSVALALRKKFGFRSQTLKSIMPSEKKR